MNYHSKIILILVALGIAMLMYSGVLGDEAQTPAGSSDNGDTGHALDGWLLGGAFNIISTGIGNTGADTLWGPSLHLYRLNPGGIGFDFGFTYILPSGFYGFTGLSAEVALSYGFSITNGTIFLLKGGVSGLVGGDSDGSAGGNAAIFPGIGMAQQIVGPLAINAEVIFRIWVADEKPTVGGRLGLLLKL
jgi:hypothetical protein